MSTLQALWMAEIEELVQRELDHQYESGKLDGIAEGRRLERERGVEVWVCEERFSVDTENDARRLVLALSAELNKVFPNEETRAILIPLEPREAIGGGE